MLGVHHLMMPGGNISQLHTADDIGQPAGILRHSDPVASPVRLVAVGTVRLGVLAQIGGQVLNQTATQSHVQSLHTAANTQCRHVLGDKAAPQAEIRHVADVAELIRRSYDTVAGWIFTVI